jgi:putative membrane protein
LSVNEGLGAPGRGGGEGVRTRDHLANVRTFLAWVRAGLVLLGLGYALTKFAAIENRSSQSVGVISAAAGWLVVVLAGVSFFRQRRAIESAVYAPSPWLNIVLTIVAAAGGCAILIYLLHA